MRSAIPILSVLTAPLTNAMNAPNPISGTTGLYAPTYMMDTPANWPGGENANITLKCQKPGQTCMRFPQGAPENETISVRVLCVSKKHGDDKEKTLFPVKMNPCPADSRCALVVEEPTPPSVESWLRLEKEDEEEEEVDVSSWMSLDGLLHEVADGIDGVNSTDVGDEGPDIPEKNSKKKLVCIVDEETVVAGSG
ncbi:hypothetical protein GQX73_g10079 [Xylaria multiplex]|uniref:Uncharacterized protein n=1 Tax=Xylaria multiplex TaxID=323545 RepID=A0A7C8ITI0_9PEZI|nr:hypothetical protein GQX73_g10079 [Xylaria multiplex]